MIYIILYCIAGYCLALLYYLKFDEINGNPIEHKEVKTVATFLVWPLLVMITVLLIPFALIASKKAKSKKEAL